MGQKFGFPREFIIFIALQLELEELQTEVFVGYFVDGLSTSEIAKELNIRPNTVNKRMSGVYKTFGINRPGRGKMRELRRRLVKRFKECHTGEHQETELAPIKKVLTPEEEIKYLREEIVRLNKQYESVCKEVATQEEELDWDTPIDFLDDISQRIVDREKAPLELLSIVGVVLPQLLTQWSLTSNIYISRDIATIVIENIKSILTSIEAGVLPQDAD